MLFNIAAELLSLANACGVFKAFIDGEMWSFETSKVKGHSVKFFILNQNVVCLKFILTKFQVSTPFRFQDITL